MKNILSTFILVLACIFLFDCIGFQRALGEQNGGGQMQGPPGKKNQQQEDRQGDGCFNKFQSVLGAAPQEGAWKEGVLGHLHEQLYRFNTIETADIELIFCRLINVMGVDPDLSKLPQTVTKTDPLGATISITVSVPTEGFATLQGYTAKAVFENNGAIFMALWWAGNGDTSKGYVIQGANPMERDGNTRLRYAMWDRTTAAQSVKIFATQFVSAYLGAPEAPTLSKTGGDHVHFGRISYDSATKAVSAQSVEIRAKNPSDTNLKCLRTYFTGTLGGTIAGYRPANGTPEAVNETSTGGASAIGGGGMDGETGLVDSVNAADRSGVQSPGSALPTATFDYSCNDLNTASATGNVFAGGAVDFTKAPSAVFPR